MLSIPPAILASRSFYTHLLEAAAHSWTQNPGEALQQEASRAESGSLLAFLSGNHHCIFKVTAAAASKEACLYRNILCIQEGINYSCSNRLDTEFLISIQQAMWKVEYSPLNSLFPSGVEKLQGKCNTNLCRGIKNKSYVVNKVLNFIEHIVVTYLMLDFFSL